MKPSDIAAKVDDLSRKLSADPAKAQLTYGFAAASLLDGLKFEVRGPGGERVETDMPHAMGGEGSAPTPAWLFRAAYAACSSSMIALQAARLGIDLTALEVKVIGQGNQCGMLGLDDTISAGHSALRTEVRIASSNAAPEQLRELVQWAERHSPVGCTVRDAPANSLMIEIA